MRTLLVILILLIPMNVWGALVKGTNCGFVTVAPSVDPSATAAAVDALAVGLKDAAPATGTVTEIGFWVDSQGDEGQNWEVAIYDHDAGNDRPNIIIGSDKTNTLSAGAGWKSVTGLSIAITSGTTYWIAIQVDNSTTATNYNYGVVDANRYYYLTSQTTLPDPFGAGGTAVTRLNSIYAVYTISGATPTMPNQSIIISKYIDKLKEGL